MARPRAPSKKFSYRFWLDQTYYFTFAQFLHPEADSVEAREIRYVVTDYGSLSTPVVDSTHCLVSLAAGSVLQK